MIIILLGNFHLWGRFYTVLQLTNFSGENSKSSHSSMFKEHVDNSSALFWSQTIYVQKKICIYDVSLWPLILKACFLWKSVSWGQSIQRRRTELPKSMLQIFYYEEGWKRWFSVYWVFFLGWCGTFTTKTFATYFANEPLAHMCFANATWTNVTLAKIDSANVTLASGTFGWWAVEHWDGEQWNSWMVSEGK